MVFHTSQGRKKRKIKDHLNISGIYNLIAQITKCIHIRTKTKREITF